jgi:hypothetical protein
MASWLIGIFVPNCGGQRHARGRAVQIPNPHMVTRIHVLELEPSTGIMCGMN